MDTIKLIKMDTIYNFLNTIFNFINSSCSSRISEFLSYVTHLQRMGRYLCKKVHHRLTYFGNLQKLLSGRVNIICVLKKLMSAVEINY